MAKQRKSSKKPAETATKASPGSQLKQAREKAGISLEHVSEKTLISVNRLKALEADDIKSVGSVAYVLGYARSVAETVGVDPKPLVKAFEDMLSSDKASGFTEVRETSNSSPTQAAPKLPNKWLVGIGVILLPLVIAGVILMTSNDDADSRASRPEVVFPVTGSPSEDNLSVEVSQEAEPPQIVTPDMEAAESYEINPEAIMDEAEKLAEVEVNAIVEEALEEIQETELQELQPTQAKVDTTAVKKPPESLDLLGLFFTEECWVEVTDATGKRIIAQVAASGDSLQLFGRAPFSVMLGNAEAALVELNGENIPVIPKPGKRTLRLSAGE